MFYFCVGRLWGVLKGWFFRIFFFLYIRRFWKSFLMGIRGVIFARRYFFGVENYWGICYLFWVFGIKFVWLRMSFKFRFLVLKYYFFVYSFYVTGIVG